MNYEIAYAACRGSAHISLDEPCQDVVTGWATLDTAAIALADGAGSCKYSLIGAQSVTGAVSQLLKTWCESSVPNEDAEVKKEILGVCIEALDKNPYSRKEQSCTLLFCAVDANANYLCGHIGDGYIFLDNGDAILLSDAENGESINETFFVTSTGAENHLRLYRGTLKSGEGILMCSDGAGDALFDKRTSMCVPAVSRIIRWLDGDERVNVSKHIEENLDLVFRNLTYDDMSIAAIRRIEKKECGGQINV